QAVRHRAGEPPHDARPLPADEEPTCFLQQQSTRILLIGTKVLLFHDWMNPCRKPSTKSSSAVAQRCVTPLLGNTFHWGSRNRSSLLAANVVDVWRVSRGVERSW